MPVTRDITDTYRGPAKVMRRLLGAGPREDRNLAFVMGFCVLAFVAQTPGLARSAHLNGQELAPLLSARFFGAVFIAPLVLYLVAAASHSIALLMGGKGSWYSARLALFWSLLAVTPVMLLQGLVAGFIGDGPELTLVTVIGAVLFLWIWFSTLRQAERAQT